VQFHGGIICRTYGTIHQGIFFIMPQLRQLILDS
jgi:hypothetical protein